MPVDGDAPDTDTDELEFYPCLVDDAPASICVNLKFEHAPHAGDTRYTIAVFLRDRGEHGIGTADEAAAIALVEDAVIARATELAVDFVGRLRARGIWEIVLYGRAGVLDPLRAIAVDRAGDRRIVARSEHDPTWSYYRELLPDAERRQWTTDRRMVQILAEQGDRLVTPRRVDHELAFPTAAARDAFVAALPSGFLVSSESELGVWVHRVDSVELEHIHDVVMLLVDAATPHGGTHARWVAGIET